ncbi:MlaD family protein [Conexibacter sp. SYSU D00693]|uniref:MlaD family protein n=1 Tax=Conexibacter sp. SYSU D00693 TaxID=2812560 RepID=UPI00196B7486|nr:MlaD family protein [Conexibacter sp. SYSU D00693]
MAGARGRLALELRRARGPFAVLAVLAVCAVAMTAALVSQQTFQRPWDDYAQVRVAFDDAKGVVAGQQAVRVAGVEVGLVKAAELEGGRAVLDLAIEERYAPVFRNATFRLRPKTPLQDMYVEMSRGTPDAGVLDASRVVPAAQSVTPVDVSRVLQSFDADARTRLRSLLTQFGAAADDGGAALRRGFTQLGPFLTAATDVADALAVRKARLRRLVSSSGDLMRALATRDDRLRRLVTDGNRALGALAAHDRELSATLGQLPGTVAELRTALARLGTAQDDLEPALTALRPAARRLGDALDGVRSLSGDLRPAAERLRPAVQELARLSSVLPRTGERLDRATSALRPQVADVDLATRQLAACETPFARFMSWTLSVIKFRDGYSSYPRGSVSLGLDSVKGNGTGVTGLTKSPNCDDQVKP